MAGRALDAAWKAEMGKAGHGTTGLRTRGAGHHCWEIARDRCGWRALRMRRRRFALPAHSKTLRVCRPARRNKRLRAPEESRNCESRKQKWAMQTTRLRDNGTTGLRTRGAGHHCWEIARGRCGWRALRKRRRRFALPAHSKTLRVCQPARPFPGLQPHPARQQPFARRLAPCKRATRETPDSNTGLAINVLRIETGLRVDATARHAIRAPGTRVVPTHKARPFQTTWVLPTDCRLEVGDTAGWKPALRANRRFQFQGNYL